MSLVVAAMVQRVLDAMDSGINNATINGEFHPELFDRMVYHDAVTSYIQENATIHAVYVGTIPSVPPVPDPLSGPHTVDMISCSNIGLKTALRVQQELCVSDALFEVNINAWWQSFIASLLIISQPTITTPVGVVTFGPPFTLLPISAKIWVKPELSVMTTREQLWTAFCTQIVLSLTTLVMPTPAAAASTMGGTGTVTFTNIT